MDDIKQNMDSKLNQLISNFNKEKDKYDKLSKQEVEMNNQFKKLQKYDTIKEQIEQQKVKEEKYDIQSLQQKLNNITEDATKWEQRRESSKMMLEQVSNDNNEL